MANDTQGDRMKRYEAASRYFLPPKQPVVIRVDGRAFHTYTRGAVKPFDHNVMDAMAHATENTARDMSGFKLAYTQSDEASFVITDFDSFETQGWFNYSLSKVISLSASLFTAHFANWWAQYGKPPAEIVTFDSRAFVMPMEDVPNYFNWRQKDWYRNSVQMLGQAYFSHKQLNEKKLSDIHDMLHEKGINWANLSPAEKNGTFIRRTTTTRQAEHGDPVIRTVMQRQSIKADYVQISDWIAPPIEELAS